MPMTSQTMIQYDPDRERPPKSPTSCTEPPQAVELYGMFCSIFGRVE